MARHFDPRKVLRQIDNRLLEQFFTRRNELLDVPWKELTEVDIQQVFDGWQKLPEPGRTEVQIILQDVNELTDQRGLAVLAEEIRWHCPIRMGEFEAISTRIDKAMWLYLNLPLAFEEGARFAEADALSTGRYWCKRNSLPKSPLQVTDEMKARLAHELTDFYSTTQGRGRYCHVENYRRANGAEYFFAYLDDYPDGHLVFGDSGQLQKQPERAAFDNVFVYCPEDGTMELYCQGGKKVREPLEELFCESVLGIEVGPAAANQAAYKLDRLKDPAFPFPTDPHDGVVDVRLRRVRLDVIAVPGQRVILEVGPKGERGEIHHVIAEYLNQQNLPMSSVRVTLATFQLTFASENGSKPKTLTFDLSYPSSSNLKSKPDEMRAIGERCLKMWGIING